VLNGSHECSSALLNKLKNGLNDSLVIFWYYLKFHQKIKKIKEFSSLNPIISGVSESELIVGGGALRAQPPEINEIAF